MVQERHRKVCRLSSCFLYAVWTQNESQNEPQMAPKFVPQRVCKTSSEKLVQRVLFIAKTCPKGEGRRLWGGPRGGIRGEHSDYIKLYKLNLIKLKQQPLRYTHQRTVSGCELEGLRPMPPTPDQDHNHGPSMVR